MLKSILWKEFREALPLAAIALATEGLLLGFVTQLTEPSPHPFIVFPFLYILGFLFPIVLGVWQVSREALGNQYQFLLHRPMNRGTILGTKLLFGAFLSLIVIVIPLLLFTLWVRRQHFGPGEPIDMFPFCCNLFLLYVAAFLSALRPGLWYGSKFLPLMAAILLFIVLQTTGDVSAWWFDAAMVAAMPLVMCYLASIFYVARTRDFS